MVTILREGKESILDSFVVISDDLKHDSTAVLVFFHKLFGRIKAKYKHVQNIHIWSDGCAAQYKSKLPFFHISRGLGQESYTLTWNFFGSRHGKSAADGEAGVVKSTLARLLKDENILIDNAADLFRVVSSSRLKVGQ